MLEIINQNPQLQLYRYFSLFWKFSKQDIGNLKRSNMTKNGKTYDFQYANHSCTS